MRRCTTRGTKWKNLLEASVTVRFNVSVYWSEPHNTNQAAKMAKVPNDELFLEMEETEGLVSSPDPFAEKNEPSSSSPLTSSSKYWIVGLVMVILFAGGAQTFAVSSRRPASGLSGDNSTETTTTTSSSDVQSRLVSKEGDKWKPLGEEDDFGAGHYGPKDQIVRLERPLTQNQRDALTKEWGKWSFVDKQASTRPEPSFMDDFPNRDVPSDKFPSKAWQKDPVYLKDFLDEGLALVDRAMEAIMSEYGCGKKDKPNDDFETREKTTFGLQMVDMATFKGTGKVLPRNGGWTDQKSFDGLVRRVLHAIMTQDTFTLILSGHSAAAGHGYVQSLWIDGLRVFLYCFSL